LVNRKKLGAGTHFDYAAKNPENKGFSKEKSPYIYVDLYTRRAYSMLELKRS
jgi:hypothetical protein